MNATNGQQPASDEPKTDHVEPIREVLAEELFQGQKSVVIRFGASRYVLTITKSKKLILTK